MWHRIKKKNKKLIESKIQQDKTLFLSPLITQTMSSNFGNQLEKRLGSFPFSSTHKHKYTHHCLGYFCFCKYFCEFFDFPKKKKHFCWKNKIKQNDLKTKRATWYKKLLIIIKMNVKFEIYVEKLMFYKETNQTFFDFNIENPKVSIHIVFLFLKFFRIGKSHK
jgi:hypothetical protein